MINKITKLTKKKFVVFKITNKQSKKKKNRNNFEIVNRKNTHNIKTMKKQSCHNNKSKCDKNL